jgi:hypothetical protein
VKFTVRTPKKLELVAGLPARDISNGPQVYQTRGALQKDIVLKHRFVICAACHQWMINFCSGEDVTGGHQVI